LLQELAESAEQSQEKDGDKAESLISFLNPVMMPQHLDQPAPQGDDDVEAGDPWALSQSQAGPNLSASGSGSGAGPSPAVPSTPNNTPFGRPTGLPPSAFPSCSVQAVHRPAPLPFGYQYQNLIPQQHQQ